MKDRARGFLVKYFTEGVGNYHLADRVGMEVETQFIDSRGQPIAFGVSQQIFRELYEHYNWRPTEVVFDGETYCKRITRRHGDDLEDAIGYELGRHHLEVSVAPDRPFAIIGNARLVLDELYEAASRCGASPFFGPVLDTDEDLLVSPAILRSDFIKLNGRASMTPLTRCSSVQFTIDAPTDFAITCLNRLGRALPRFLADYPQETLWRNHVRDSLAGFHPLRYGGPVSFDSSSDSSFDIAVYCAELLKHDVIVGTRLVPARQTFREGNLDPLFFVKSIWWYFRLRRYGDRLCIEVRPIPRRSDRGMNFQLHEVLEVMGFSSKGGGCY